MASPGAGDLLELRGLAVSAGGQRLFSGIDVVLRPGEIVGMVARSGTGKTTLLRAIAGLADPDAGDVLLRGGPPAEIGWPAFRRQVVLVEQQPVFLPSSVEHGLRRPFEYGTADAEYPAARAAELLDRLGVGRARLPQEAASLSVGQQQRVALVRALLLAPPVLLLDEPTSALDRDAVADVEAVLREFVTAGRAALVVTHDPQQAERLCDRVIHLSPAQSVA